MAIYLGPRLVIGKLTYHNSASRKRFYTKSLRQRRSIERAGIWQKIKVGLDGGYILQNTRIFELRPTPDSEKPKF